MREVAVFKDPVTSKCCAAPPTTPFQTLQCGETESLERQLRAAHGTLKGLHPGDRSHSLLAQRCSNWALFKLSPLNAEAQLTKRTLQSPVPSKSVPNWKENPCDTPDLSPIP